MTRQDGRAFDELRPIKITPDFVKFAEGSCLIQCGDTMVLCCASVEDRVPPHVPEGTGWVTAEYSMLPRANRERSKRDIAKLKLSPRSAEIQRLVGRSLRAAVDLAKLGEHTITIDCDVLQGDGGTRTASVTGGGAGSGLPEAGGGGRAGLQSHPAFRHRGVCGNRRGDPYAGFAVQRGQSCPGGPELCDE